MAEIILRPLQDSDVALFTHWLTVPHVAKWYEHPEAWLEEVQNRNEKYPWLHHLIAMDGEEAVGFGQYYPYRMGGEDWHGSVTLDGTYSIDYLIGDPERLGKGLGRAIIRSLLSLIEKEPGARRVIVQPDEENAASCRALLSAGLRYDAENRLYLYEF